MCTNRNIDAYENTLEIPITKEFVGKTVLDLGSGEQGQFAEAAVKRGINIYSLSGALGEVKDPKKIDRYKIVLTKLLPR